MSPGAGCFTEGSSGASKALLITTCSVRKWPTIRVGRSSKSVGEGL
jgi:hypothetical protein